MGSEVIIVPIIVIGLPWLIFHYITQWKKQGSLTREDENLLEELYDLARRLDERMCSIERIIAADNPNWKQLSCDPLDEALDRPVSTVSPTIATNEARRIGR